MIETSIYYSNKRLFEYRGIYIFKLMYNVIMFVTVERIIDVLL